MPDSIRGPLAPAAVEDALFRDLEALYSLGGARMVEPAELVAGQVMSQLADTAMLGRDRAAARAALAALERLCAEAAELASDLRQAGAAA